MSLSTEKIAKDFTSTNLRYFTLYLHVITDYLNGYFGIFERLKYIYTYYSTLMNSNFLTASIYTSLIVAALILILTTKLNING